MIRDHPKVHCLLQGSPSLLPSCTNLVPSPQFNLLKIHSNIILPLTPVYSMWPLSLRFPHPNSVYASSLPHTCHMPPVRSLITLDNKIIYIFFHTPLSSKPNSIFCAVFRYSVSLFPARFLSDALLKCEENLYLHYIIDSI